MAITMKSNGLFGAGSTYTDGESTRKFLVAPKKELIEKCNNFAEYDFLVAFDKLKTPSVETVLACVDKEGKGIAITRVAELLGLAGCQSKDEIKFVLGLKQFQTGSKKEDMVNFVTENKSLGLNRISTLIEIAKNANLPKDLSKLATSEIVGAELKTADKLKTTYTDSLSATDEKTMGESDAAFQREFETFMNGFTEKYVSSFFNEIKTLEPGKAKDFLQSKFKPLMETIVQQFQNQYRGKYRGVSFEQMEKIDAEKNRRSVIVADTVRTSFGDFFEKAVQQVVAETGKSKEEIVGQIQGYNQWTADCQKSTRSIQKIKDDHRDFLEEKSDEFDLMSREQAEFADPAFAERDDVAKKQVAVNNLHKSTKALSEFLSELVIRQREDHFANINLCNKELSEAFPEEFAAYQKLFKTGRVPEAKKRVEEAEAQHKAVKNTKKEPEALKTLKEARDALDVAKKSIKEFGEELISKGGFLGYLLTTYITELEGFGVGAETEESIKNLDVEKVESITAKVKTLLETLKEGNKDWEKEPEGSSMGG